MPEARGAPDPPRRVERALEKGVQRPVGGAAGEDPVGAAVRRLRAQSPSLAAFLNRISWMWSYAQLQQAVGGE